jgi:hypothetical protein
MGFSWILSKKSEIVNRLTQNIKERLPYSSKKVKQSFLKTSTEKNHRKKYVFTSARPPIF